MQDELQCSETGEPLWDVRAHGVTQSICSLHILATPNHRPSLSVLPSNGPRLAIQKHLKQSTNDRRWDVCKMMALGWRACVSHKLPSPCTGRLDQCLPFTGHGPSFRPLIASHWLGKSPGKGKKLSQGHGECWDYKARLSLGPNFRPHTLCISIWKKTLPHTSCWLFLSNLAFGNSWPWADKSYNPIGQSDIFQNLRGDHYPSALIYWRPRVPREVERNASITN